MPINAHPEYLAAEKEYLQAQTIEDRIEKLKKMISTAPGHKGAENLRAQLKTRLKKFQQQLEKNRKTGKASRQGIKKEDMQAVIIGFKNSGKSSLLDLLTNLQPETSEVKLTTTPLVGMMSYAGVQIQIIENPAINSEYYDKGLTNTADTILILVENLAQIEGIKSCLERTIGEKIIAFNKSDLLSSVEKRKIASTLQSKKYNFVLISIKEKENLEELKEKIFQSFKRIRVFTKEPRKEKSKNPVVLKPDSDVRDVAEKIFGGFSKNVKETKIWGPSSKFPGQKVGLNHKLKDLDIVEFKTK